MYKIKGGGEFKAKTETKKLGVIVLYKSEVCGVSKCFLVIRSSLGLVIF